jgi:hypothetical protein
MLAFLGLGITLIVKASAWGADLANMLNSVGGTDSINTKNGEWFAMSLQRQGISLIVSCVFATYFMLVVFSHYQQVRDGSSEDQVKPYDGGYPPNDHQHHPPPSQVQYSTEHE